MIEVGNYVPTACAAVGITSRTYNNWLAAGRQVNDMIDDRDDYDDLVERMRNGELVLSLSPQQVRSFLFFQDASKATAKAEAYAVAMVRKHMPDQWTAAMTFLERRFPSRWKRRDQLDIGDANEVGTGIDEGLLLSDPAAVRMVHDALELVTKGALPPGSPLASPQEKSPAEMSSSPQEKSQSPIEISDADIIED